MEVFQYWHPAAVKINFQFSFLFVDNTNTNADICQTFLLMVANRVTRFGKSLPLWQKFASCWQICDGLFLIWQNAEPTLANLWHYWANFHCCKWSHIEKESNHLVALQLANLDRFPSRDKGLNQRLFVKVNCFNKRTRSTLRPCPHVGNFSIKRYFNLVARPC